ncbi:MAG: hypothetical protein J1F06_04780 [Prevotellaceae bacterium]|nr:hypothetical protein [Prevotellaceae bacterium]
MAEIDKTAKINSAEIDKSPQKHLAEIDKSTIIALYINGYGRKFDIVQAQDVRPAAQMEARA